MRTEVGRHHLVTLSCWQLCTGLASNKLAGVLCGKWMGGCAGCTMPSMYVMTCVQQYRMVCICPDFNTQMGYLHRASSAAQAIKTRTFWPHHDIHYCHYCHPCHYCNHVQDTCVNDTRNPRTTLQKSRMFTGQEGMQQWLLLLSAHTLITAFTGGHNAIHWHS